MKLKKNLMFFLIVVIVLWVFYSFIFGKIYFLLFWNEKYPYSSNFLSDIDRENMLNEFRIENGDVWDTGHLIDESYITNGTKYKELLNQLKNDPKVIEEAKQNKKKYYQQKEYEIKKSLMGTRKRWYSANININLDNLGYITRLSMYRRKPSHLFGDGDDIKGIKEFLDKNSRYFGIKNVEELKISINDGRISVGQQYYNGIPVHKTKIGIGLQHHENDNRSVTAMHLGMGGHWYYNISAPVYPRISKQEARIKLSGMKIPWYAGLTGTKGEYIIKGTERLRFEKLIYPYNNLDEGKLEFRLVWKITVSGMYNVYMDAITGEVLRTEQLWIS